MPTLKNIFSKIFQTKVFLPLLIIFYLLNFFFNGEPFVRSDGWGYFHIAKSILNEGNFISKVKPEYWNYMEHAKSTINGNYVTPYLPGTSIAILPGLAVANLLNDINSINSINGNDFFLAYNGNTLFEGISIIITAFIFSIISWILIYKSLRLLGFSERNSWFSTLMVFLSSYALWYVFIMPSYTHTYEIFCTALVFYTYIRIQKPNPLGTKPKNNFKSYLICGAAAGFAVLIRPTLFPIALIVGLAFLFQKKTIKQLVFFALGGIPFLITLLAYNYISYGNALIISYSAVAGVGFDFSNIKIFEMLFSPFKGWLVFSPIYLLSFWGLLLFYKRNRGLCLVSLLSIFSVALLYSAWFQWWGGGSYGSRFMCFAVPLGAIGIANLLSFSKRNRNVLISLVILFTLFSTAILFLYRVVNIYGSWFYSPMYLFKTEVGIIKEALSSQGSSDNSIPSNPISRIFSTHYNYIYEGSGLWKLYNKDFLYALTILENTDNSTIEFKLFAPPYIVGGTGTNDIAGTTLPLPTNLKYYLVDNSKGFIYEGYWEPIKPLTITPEVTSIDLHSINLQIVESFETLPKSEYAGIQFTSSEFKLYILLDKNIAIRGDLIVPPREEPNYKL
jgi:hypothetical protein